MAAKGGSVQLLNALNGPEARFGRKGPCHTHSTTILCLKDTHSQPCVDWPPEVHRKPTNNPTKTTLHPQGQNTHKDFAAFPSLCPHKSSPHFLCGCGNTTYPQSHPPHTFVALPVVCSASLTAMASPSTPCHAHRKEAPGRPGFKSHT